MPRFPLMMTTRKKRAIKRERAGSPWTFASADAMVLLLSGLAAAAAFLAFPQALRYALALLLPAAGAFYDSFHRLAAFRRRSREGRDFLRLLEELAAAVSAGSHPERALLQAAGQLAEDLGRGSSLLAALQELRAKLMSGLDPRRSLAEFQKRFQHPKSLEFSRVFPLLASAGGRLDLYLQLHRDAFARELQSEEEAAAERGGASAEALVMSLMPFLLSWLGQQLNFFVLEAEKAAPAQAVFYLLSVAAFALCLRLLTPEDRLPTLPRLLFFQPLAQPKHRLRHDFFCFYPSDSGARVRSALRRLYPRSPFLEENYLRAKGRFLLAGSFLLLLSASLLRSFLPLLFLPLVGLYHELQLFQTVREERRRETLFWPPFLQLMVLLLESGLTGERALRLALLCRLDGPMNAKREKRAVPSPSQRELMNLQRRVNGGLPASAALQEAGKSRSHAEIAQFFFRLSRYDRAGGREELDGLRSQSLRLLDLHRLARRREAGRQSLLLLLPMALDLLLVMGISILPALLQSHLI